MKRNWSSKKPVSDRTRLLLTLELAIILPAASLLAFSAWNLHNIQRDKAIEAAIQRDFTYALKFAEKKTWLRATEMLAPMREEFPPCSSESDVKEEIARLLDAHPEFLYAILYNKDNDTLIWRSRPNGDADENF